VSLGLRKFASILNSANS